MSMCGVSTAVALHKVFIAPAQRASPHALPRISCSSAPYFQVTQRRWVAITPKEPPKRTNRLPQNEDITDRFILLRDKDGQLSNRSVRTSDVLASLDRKKQRLVMLSESESDGFGNYREAVCGVEDQALAYMRQKQKQQKAKNGGAATTKTLEISWATGGADLAHKMDRLKEFLGKGYRVEVDLLAKGKKRGYKATEEEAEKMLQTVREAILSVEGGKEEKPMEGKLLETAKLFVAAKKVS